LEIKAPGTCDLSWIRKVAIINAAKPILMAARENTGTWVRVSFMMGDVAPQITVARIIRR
jgi:hypothetical protein